MENTETGMKTIGKRKGRDVEDDKNHKDRDVEDEKKQRDKYDTRQSDRLNYFYHERVLARNQRDPH